MCFDQPSVLFTTARSPLRRLPRLLLLPAFDVGPYAREKILDRRQADKQEWFGNTLLDRTGWSK
jgi:hypothetical protein